MGLVQVFTTKGGNQQPANLKRDQRSWAAMSCGGALFCVLPGHSLEHPGDVVDANGELLLHPDDYMSTEKLLMGRI